MIDVVAYRGPDGAGQLVLQDEGIALGHRRLSIIDLTEDGRQPMLSADGRFVLTFNGEIYNYLEVRKDLEGLGHVFRSHSDTEVLLLAYAQWGGACLERLIGMYAFAIWDRKERELFAARDRLGIKPFYYYVESDGALYFASEIKSILATGEVAREVDSSLIDSYMEFGYVPGDETLHKGVKRLLPGHSLTWRDAGVSVRQYWDLRFDGQTDIGLTASAERIKANLEDAIALHLRADVPLGVFLSGGLDSSAVVSLLSPGAAAGLKTFSVAYDLGAGYDETPFARLVASKFSTDHHEIRMSPQSFRDFIPSYVWHMDEPVADSAAISLYHVSRLARESVTVCLSGEGSDEIFAGYDFYIYNLAIGRAQALVGRRSFAALRGLMGSNARAGKLRKYVDMAAKPLERRYRGISTYEPDKKNALYSADFRPRAASGGGRVAGFVEQLFSRSRNWDPLSRMLYFDTKTWLVDHLLTKADRMSMATSIELRVPFLDHRVVECAATIPSRYKIRGRDTKHVLKKALEGKLPSEILQRRKLGFPTPIERMFRSELAGYAQELLLSPKALQRGYFDSRSVERLLADHRNGRASNHREIWQLVVLEEWHRRFGL
jgi:asparagine synthase (glutamine-hydrolysing)